MCVVRSSWNIEADSPTMQQLWKASHECMSISSFVQSRSTNLEVPQVKKQLLSITLTISHQGFGTLCSFVLPSRTINPLVGRRGCNLLCCYGADMFTHPSPRTRPRFDDVHSVKPSCCTCKPVGTRPSMWNTKPACMIGEEKKDQRTTATNSLMVGSKLARFYAFPHPLF